ncbi:hypothetical protein EST38_g5892 [Candolleomyces aberdarensis]|uniref:Uncharacterized protein n=1 Tax=Candolleomyces aberdarensis TaxID=2316362 RepID=A0A4Q2DJE9_9AGAR|nr:hypothetical protein EST38_g5892 [Candolleomyces aberdarensis]
MNPSQDYIQLLHNHVGGQWEELRSESPGMHTLRYLIRGDEVGRATASRKVFAKKIVAYRYLRDKKLIFTRDQEMEAQL